tara:strand:+ start:85 stop:783 length:699 start_codon:yes stop_codon:yes gene_type:complete
MLEKIKHRHQTYSESKKSFLYKIFQQIIVEARNEFFKLFSNNTNYSDDKTVIDIGSTPSLDKEQNIFLENVKNNQNVTCLSNQDCKILQKKYKNIKNILIGDGKYTNLEDNSFDIVHSNATIEHVGSFENQTLFVKELLRISKESVFIQTPNRFYPIDFHTILPFFHWLPKKIHRKILEYLKLEFYAKEENLNLLSIINIKNICKILNIKKYKILKYKLFFFTSNLLLVIYK